MSESSIQELWKSRGETRPDKLVEEATYTITGGKIVVTLPVLDAISTIRESEPITLDFKSMKAIDIPAAVQDAANPSSASDPHTNSILERDDTYYLPMIIFEVEDTQFMVPRWQFPKSTTYFCRIIPESPYNDCVINLGSISAKDFRGMMEFMYPMHSIECDLKLTKDVLISVLKVSTQWKMLKHRKHAMNELGFSGPSSPPSSYTLTPEEDIILGKTCGVPSWYRRGCAAVVATIDLELQHHDKLGIDTMIKLMRARDQVYVGDLRSYNLQFSFHSRPYHNTVLNLFRDESGDPLAKLPVIERISVARTYGLSDWMLSCYHQLVEREESLSLEEVEVLGIETTLKIWKARHELFRTCRDILQRFQSPHSSDIAEAVEKEFKEEFKEAEKLISLLRQDFRPREESTQAESETLRQDQPSSSSPSDMPVSGGPTFGRRWPSQRFTRRASRGIKR